MRNVLSSGKILDRRWKCAGSDDNCGRRWEQRQGNIRTIDIFAHVVGYTASGKILVWSLFMNFELLTSNAFFLDKLKNEFQDKKNPGR